MDLEDQLFSVFSTTEQSSEKSKKRKDGTSQSESATSQPIKKLHTEDNHENRKQVTDATNSMEYLDKISEQNHEKDDIVVVSNENDQELTKSNGEIISCLHEVCLPPGWNEPVAQPSFPTNPVRVWPFQLDPFQKKAISCLEAGQSVLVSAHTSAGKTVVAEYAIAMSLKAKQRVIYTSPIKALSNQKYRELYESFNDVGLMTGDITINQNASCLVMTTEILRSMLYRGSEVIREVAWVIFDEIHYMRDKERGVVWEETIILLPDATRFVFLSATIPNAAEFATWVAKVHKQPCNVVYTEYRPTPLQHYIFPAGGDGLHLVVDEKGVFKEDNFQRAIAALNPRDNNQKPRNKKAGKAGGDVYKIVKMIMERNYQPVIVFSFSKKECEALALQMSKIDLTEETEKKSIDKIFNNAVDSLSDDDKNLPQVVHILPLLRRGVGIHHSGLLPILKEVIEILFQEGLLKALFATETFSMGLNMPAKTVVFTSVRKFDGENFRWVTGGEYIQMSGRAGRRGLDDRGIVILMVDEKMEPAVAKGMVKGSADPLYSSFHIGYNMLLNLLRLEEMDPETMLKKSFHQFQNDRQLPDIQQKIHDLESERSQITIDNEAVIGEYYGVKDQLSKFKDEMKSIIIQPIHSLPYLQPGRLVLVKDGSLNWGWGVVVNFQKKQDKASGVTDGDSNVNAQYIVDVLLNCISDESNKSKAPQPCPPEQAHQGQMQVVPVMLNLLDSISSIRIYIPKDLRSQENRQSVGKSVQEVQKRFKDGIPVLDPIEDMKISDPQLQKVVRKIEQLEDRFSSKEFQLDNLPEKYELFKKKVQLENDIKNLKKQVKNGENVVLRNELKCMKRVLRRLGYTNSDDIIETKGRVACEINAADELVITELIFCGVFNDLSAEQTVALLSCFTFQEKVEGNVKLREELIGPWRQIQETARRIAKVSQESKITIDVEEYVKSFSPHMMEVAYSWARGVKFSEICGMTDIFEGSIIRAFRRLEELLRQLASAAKAIGNTELENKFAQGITMIKRDIVFAASLYLL